MSMASIGMRSSGGVRHLAFGGRICQPRRRRQKIELEPKSWNVRRWKRDGWKLDERVGGGFLETSLGFGYNDSFEIR
jgi:hypothetical protein